jgi:hypothetical protein
VTATVTLRARAAGSLLGLAGGGSLANQLRGLVGVCGLVWGC